MLASKYKCKTEWSLSPSTTEVLFISSGLVVKTRSRMLAEVVVTLAGLAIICVKLQCKHYKECLRLGGI